MLYYNRLWINKFDKRSIIYKGRENFHGKDQKRIANLKVAGKLKVYRMTVLVMTLFFSVGGTDLDISDPFKYREDH